MHVERRVAASPRGCSWVHVGLGNIDGSQWMLVGSRGYWRVDACDDNVLVFIAATSMLYVLVSRACRPSSSPRRWVADSMLVFMCLK